MSESGRLGVESVSAGLDTVLWFEYLWANAGLYKVRLSIFAVLYRQDLREHSGLL